MSKQAYSHYLLEVKQEYTKQLSNMLVPVMYEGLMSIYNEAKKLKKDSPMKTFQILLSRIPQWNQNIINNEYQRIISKTQCDWINDLITAVFISHAKILSSIRTKKNSKTLNLKVPNGDYFVHKAYIECARQFWKTPYLFYDEVNTIEYQRNLREIEAIIEQSINETIRKLLPVKNILQQYIALEESDSSSSEEEEEDDEETVEEQQEPTTKKKSKYDEEYITSSITEKDKKKLEKSVKKEISKVLPEKDDDNHSIVSVSHEIPTAAKRVKRTIVPKVMEINPEPSMELPIEKHPSRESILKEGQEPSKLREDHNDSYESLDENNSHHISLDKLKPYPPLINRGDEDLYSSSKKGETSRDRESLFLETDDIDKFDRMSMNTKLDATYQPPNEEEFSEKEAETQSMKIDIDEIPKIEEHSLTVPKSISREEEIPKSQAEIKTVVINMNQGGDNEKISGSGKLRQGFAMKRDLKKNYKFFD